jgi:predicted DNA binding CopG/RHH family protein
MKPIQYFSDEYLERCKKMSTKEILEFLECYRIMHTPDDPTTRVGLRIPQAMLKTFRTKCELSGVKYQTQIKNLMREWIG